MSRSAPVGTYALLLLLLPFGSCGGPTEPTTTTADPCLLPPLAGRQSVEYDLGVGKAGSEGCDGVGGTPVVAAQAGALFARSRWSDPAARLKTEIWQGRFERLLAGGQSAPGGLCVAASADVAPGLYVVRTCHTADSAVPQSAPDDARHFTRYQLTVYYP